jgi:hypothetical protein
MLLSDPNWKPTRKACGEKNLILCPDADERVWKRIVEGFISKRLLFTDAQCSAVALAEVKKLPVALQPKRVFKASRDWVRKFRERHMVSLRTPHLLRRPKPNLACITKFIHTLNEAKRRGMDPRHILNAEETNWPVIFANRLTWDIAHERNAQHSDIVAFNKGDPKSSFTVMAGITMNGDALPLFMLTKGKTPLSLNGK